VKVNKKLERFDVKYEKLCRSLQLPRAYKTRMSEQSDEGLRAAPYRRTEYKSKNDGGRFQTIKSWLSSRLNYYIEKNMSRAWKCYTPIFLLLCGSNYLGVCLKVCERVVGTDFESVAKLWPNDKKLKVVNVCTNSTLWAIWKLGNDFWVKLMSFVFRGQVG
jgi:hypothetical protein